MEFQGEGGRQKQKFGGRVQTKKPSVEDMDIGVIIKKTNTSKFQFDPECSDVINTWAPGSGTWATTPYAIELK